jgi:polygalacturonase
MPEILNRIRPPAFPARDFPMARHPKPTAKQTAEAFRNAIAECAAAGGRRVTVPEGAWLTGAIHLKSNVNLHLAKGAVIRFSRDPAHYLPAVFTR